MLRNTPTSPLMYSPQIIQYRNIFFDRINIVEINQSHKTSVRGDKYANEEDTYYDDEKVVGIISNYEMVPFYISQ